MMSTLFEPLRVAFIVAWGVVVLSAGGGSLATLALAQAAQVPAQAEQPDQPRTPHAGEPTATRVKRSIPSP
jgi:hypothetical protein